MMVEVKNNNEKKIRLPALMKSKCKDNVIIFVIEENENSYLGFALTPSDEFNIGYYSNLWDKNSFEQFEGIVTIRNHE